MTQLLISSRDPYAKFILKGKILRIPFFIKKVAVVTEINKNWYVIKVNPKGKLNYHSKESFSHWWNINLNWSQIQSIWTVLPLWKQKQFFFGRHIMMFDNEIKLCYKLWTINYICVKLKFSFHFFSPAFFWSATFMAKQT